MKGQPSNMTRGRIIQLNSIGFQWVSKKDRRL